MEGIPLVQLMDDVETFARDHDLLELVDILKKGARVAQNPGSFEENESLDQKELELLRQEKDHKWKHPITLYLTVALCSMGAAVQYVSIVVFQDDNRLTFQGMGSNGIEWC